MMYIRPPWQLGQLTPVTCTASTPVLSVITSILISCRYGKKWRDCVDPARGSTLPLMEFIVQDGGTRDPVTPSATLSLILGWFGKSPRGRQHLPLSNGVFI